MLTLRKPVLADVPRMHSLMVPGVQAEALLPRSPRQIAAQLRDYTVVEVDGVVVGLAALTVVELHLAEVGAVVAGAEVLPHLLRHLLDEARDLGVERVFVLTADGAPFEAQGFDPVDVAEVPEKRDRQCLRCPRLPRCRQVALVRTVAEHEGRREAA